MLKARPHSVSTIVAFAIMTASAIFFRGASAVAGGSARVDAAIGRTGGNLVLPTALDPRVGRGTPGSVGDPKADAVKGVSSARIAPRDKMKGAAKALSSGSSAAGNVAKELPTGDPVLRSATVSAF